MLCSLVNIRLRVEQSRNGFRLLFSVGLGNEPTLVLLTHIPPRYAQGMVVPARRNTLDIPLDIVFVSHLRAGLGS